MGIKLSALVTCSINLGIFLHKVCLCPPNYIDIFCLICMAFAVAMSIIGLI